MEEAPVMADLVYTFDADGAFLADREAYRIYADRLNAFLVVSHIR